MLALFSLQGGLPQSFMVRKVRRNTVADMLAAEMNHPRCHRFRRHLGDFS